MHKRYKFTIADVADNNRRVSSPTNNPIKINRLSNQTTLNSIQKIKLII